MHDPTEGGVAGGINELADAAGLGVTVFEDRILVAPETAKICHFFRVDPLQLIGSGALLVAAQAEKAEGIIGKLHARGVQAAVIGEFTADPDERLLTKKTGEVHALPRPKSDHLWKALSRR